jgi:hypothetical protein
MWPTIRSRNALSSMRVKAFAKASLQDLRELLQPAGADAVFSVFVFLNLLKRQIERAGQRFPGSAPAFFAASAPDFRHAGRQPDRHPLPC